MNSALFLVRFGIVVWFASTAVGISIADVIDRDKIKNDQETIQLATNYSVTVVRTAISKCREGKFQDAVPVLEKFAADRDIGATYVLAKLYSDGLGVEKSRDRAIELFQNNAEGGHAPSMVELAQLKESDSPAEALQLFKMASSAGEVSAHVKLGGIMENGLLGVTPNPQLAFKYFEKAMIAESPAGVFHVARCYDDGIGVSPNAIESTRLFRRAAMAGIPVANTLMARRYFEGNGVEPDPVAAVGWLLRGAQAGSTEAMVLLGQRYENGDVIGKDLNQAGQLYSAAAKRKDPTGNLLLARMYLNGIGTKSDPIRAYVLLEDAQALPQAKQEFESLEKQLTADQLARAKKIVADAKSKESEK